jgi:hypothetical protein
MSGTSPAASAATTAVISHLGGTRVINQGASRAATGNAARAKGISASPVCSAE